MRGPEHRPRAVEPVENEGRAGTEAHQASCRDGDSGLLGEVKGCFLPGHNVPLVAGVGELRESELAFVGYRRLGACAPERAGSGIE